MKKIRWLLSVSIILMLFSWSCGKSPDRNQLEQTKSPAQTAATEAPLPEKQIPSPNLGVNFDKFIPDNIYIYASVDNISKMKEDFNKSALSKVWDDPEIKKFTEKAFALIEKEFTKNVTKETEIGFKDIISLTEVFNGQAAFILDSVELKTVPKKTKMPVRDANGQYVPDQETGGLKYEEVMTDSIEPLPHLILMAQVTGNKNKLESLLSKIAKSTAQEGILKKQEDYKGVAYFTFYKKQESTKVSYGYINDIFFVSYGEKALKRIVDNYTMESGNKSLSAKPAYQKIAVNAAGRTGTVYLSVPPFISILKSYMMKEQLAYRSPTPEELDNSNKTFDKVIELCGLADLKSIIAISKSEGGDYISEGLMEIPGTKRGLWSVLSADATAEFKTIKAASDDSMMYMAGTLSLTKLYEEIINIMASVMPQEEFEKNVKAGISEFEQKLGLRIKEDILSAFGNEIGFVMGASGRKLSPYSMFPLNMSIMIPIVNPDAAKQAHAQITKIMAEEDHGGPQLTEKQYNGITMYIMEIPENPREGMPPMTAEERELMGYFFTQDMFVYAVPGSNLRQVADTLAGKDKVALPANKDFLSLLNRNNIAEKNIGLYYMNMEKYLENFYSMFTQFSQPGFGQMPGEDTDMGIGDENKGGGKPKTPQDEFAQLMKEMPKFEVIKKYFVNSKSVEQFYPTADGIMWRSLTKMSTE